jgi:hypothetical protein
VIQQPKEIGDRNNTYQSKDPDWGWARGEIAELLSIGFQEDVLPYEFRGLTWEILESLTNDSEPTPEQEAQYRDSSWTPIDRSLNTTRGKAMHSVIYYALWNRKQWEAKADSTNLSHGFDSMPEVREVLEQHLEHDHVFAIRSIYGQYFAWFVLLDTEWATRQVSRIFPADASLRDLWEMAWATYITFTNPFGNVFQILKEEYRLAVEYLDVEPNSKRNWVRGGDPDQRLVDHLISFYAQGILDLDEPEGILVKFFEKASDALRKYALESVGRSLRGTKGEIAQQVIDRLEALWSYCFNDRRRTSSVSVLGTFGWWFISEKLDREWAFAQLEEVLKLGVAIEPHHLVVNHLAKYVDHIPIPVMRCLYLMVENSRGSWVLASWRENIEIILSRVLQGDNQAAKQIARNLVNRLVADGHSEYGRLLS